jgi:hypothetical protein
MPDPDELAPFVAELESAINHAIVANHGLRVISDDRAEDATDEPARLRTAIALCEQRERELDDRRRLRYLWDVLDDLRRELARYVPDEHGNYALPDGGHAHVQPNGRVISGYSYVSEFEDSDGRTYTLAGPDDQWQVRHRGHVQALSARVRAEQVARSRRRELSPVAQVAARGARAREYRPAAARRAASSSRTSSQDPGASDPDLPAGPSWRWAHTWTGVA